MASEQGVSASRGELRTRVISAAILAPVALVSVLLGGLTFAALVTIVAVLAFWEWTGMAGAEHPSWARAVSVICLVVGLLSLQAWSGAFGVALIASAAAAALAAGVGAPAFRWLGLGVVYVAVPSVGIIVLRQVEPFGWAVILYILFVVWATDIAAYFGGRAMGGARLWPRVSPKKTWSGGLSGLVAAIAAGGVVAGLTMGNVRAGLFLAALLSVAAQAGDLLESAVKRRFGVKDSGHIIPGHGGVLDRLDGVFGAAALALILAVVGLGGGILALPGAGAAVGAAR